MSRACAQGFGLELAPRFSDPLADTLHGLGHATEQVCNVSGG